MRRKRRGGLSTFAAGVVLIVVLTAATYLAFKKAVPFQHHYTVHAAFRNSNGIVKNSFVRIAGVNVGKITGVSHLSHGAEGAMVDMTIQDKGLPLHTDATVKVRPRIFLEGNFFVDINPGSPSAPVLKDGDTIPIQQTAAPVQLDQILSVLDTSTRTQLQHLLKDLSGGISGRGGKAFNKSIPYWLKAYRGSAIVNTALLGNQQHDLSQYISASGAVAQAIDSSPPDLQGLLSHFNVVAGALAKQNVALQNSLSELPNTLRVGVPALAALNRSLPSLDKRSAELDPAVKSTRPVLVAGVPFAQQLRGLVGPGELGGLINKLTSAVPALTQLNLQSVPLLSETRYASQCQNSVILPWSQETLQDANFPASGQVYQEFPKALVGLGADSRAFDANGPYFRVLAGTGNIAFPTGPGQFGLANFPITGGNPAKATGLPAFNETTPCETQQTPNLTSTPSGAPPGQVNAASPVGAKGQSIYQHSLKATVGALRSEIKAKHLNLKVSDKPVTAAQIPHLKELAGAGR
ncbi:MAG: hypothetical protein NVS1B9_03970 [Solirubrobacteraceae bacterium]